MFTKINTMGRKVVVELSDISSFSISEEHRVKSCSNDSCPHGCKRYILSSRPGKPIWHVQTKEMRNTITQSAANKQPKAAKKVQKKRTSSSSESSAPNVVLEVAKKGEKKVSKQKKVVNRPAAFGRNSSSSSSSGSDSSVDKKAPKEKKGPVKNAKLEEINVGKKASAYPWADVQKQKQKDGKAIDKKADKKLDKAIEKAIDKKGDKGGDKKHKR